MTNEQDIIHYVTQSVVEEIIETLDDKVDRIILYGSYARGDFTPESDIDVMILLDCLPKDLPIYRKKISRIASKISLESGKEISLMLQDKRTYEEWMETLVFYQNVEKEGVVLYGDKFKKSFIGLQT